MFRINSNVPAMNSLRHLGNTGKLIQATTERLSSGLRINKASDDAPAMFISEQLRNQIAGLKQANRNVAQAGAMLQTMEGGFDQLTGILTRLKELAIQSADGSYTDSQRQNGIQVEADRLIEEMDRIIKSVNFAGRDLFPTNEGSITFQVGESDTDRVRLNLQQLNKNTLLGQFSSKIGFVSTTTNLTAAAGFDVDVNGNLTENTAGEGQLPNELKKGDVVQFTDDSGNTRQFFVKSVDGTGAATLDFTLEGQITLTKGSTTVRGIGTKFTDQVAANDLITINGVQHQVASVTSDTELELTAAPDVTDANALNGNLTFAGSATLELDAANVATGATVARADIAGQYLIQASIQDFLDQIVSGIDTVVKQRAEVGATQARLERAGTALQVQIENATNADSVIRDADMAQEISALVRAQVLAQAGTSIQNVANLQPQNVLSLLAALG